MIGKWQISESCVALRLFPCAVMLATTKCKGPVKRHGWESHAVFKERKAVKEKYPKSVLQREIQSEQK